MSIKGLKCGLSLTNIYFFVFAGYVFWMFGHPAINAIMSNSVLVEWNKNSSLNIYTIVGYSLIAYSVFLAVVSTYLGMFAIHEEKRRLIIIYVVILLLCISYQIVLSLAIVGGESESIRKSTENYLGSFSYISKEEQLKIQKFQQSNTCCGYSNSSDYSFSDYNVPNSCCGKFDASGESNQKGACAKTGVEKVPGCGEKIHKLLGSPYVSYVWNLAFFAVYFVQILAIVLSLKLRRELKFKRTESSMPIHNQAY